MQSSLQALTVQGLGLLLGFTGVALLPSAWFARPALMLAVSLMLLAAVLWSLGKWARGGEDSPSWTRRNIAVVVLPPVFAALLLIASQVQ